MPAEYDRCVESMISDGKPKSEAQRICAIRFYKRHGKTPQEAESKKHNPRQDCIRKKVSEGKSRSEARRLCKDRPTSNSYSAQEVATFEVIKLIGDAID